MRLGLHLAWIPILIVLAWMAPGPAATRSIAVMGALACGALHAVIAFLALRPSGRQPDELVLTPYGLVPLQAGRILNAPGRVWLSQVVTGVLVRLVCAIFCQGFAAADESARVLGASPWKVLQQWNLLLAWLHPLPAIPLDGSRVLRAWVGVLLPAPITNSILRRSGLTCAFALLIWSVWRDVHAPALLTALFLWHAAETATRTNGISSKEESERTGWNPDEIVVSPPPYARKENRTEPARSIAVKNLGGSVREFIAGFWAGC